jgi:hypothetical protein
MMKWISVKEKGLPKPSLDKEYFTYSSSGQLGYGSFGYKYNYDYETKKHVVNKETQWYLDFDAHGEGKITHYMEVKYPENE